MSTVLGRISAKLASLTPVEQHVAKHVQSNPERVALLSLNALAQEAGASDTTVLRFCRALGYSGYQEFKLRLIPDLLQRGAPSILSAGEDAGDLPYAAYRKRLARDVELTLANLDPDVVRRCAEGVTASSSVTAIGVGASGGVAKSLASALSAIGVRASHLSDRVDVECLADMARQDDVVFGISHSGNAPEVATALKQCRVAGALTIAITNFDPSPVARAAEVVLLTAAAESFLGSAACHPRVLQFIVLEQMLAAVVGQLAMRARPPQLSEA